MKTILLIIDVIFACVLFAEFWMGVAIVGSWGDRILIWRKKTPGPYWFLIALKTSFVTILTAMLVFSK